MSGWDRAPATTIVCLPALQAVQSPVVCVASVDEWTVRSKLRVSSVLVRRGAIKVARVIGAEHFERRARTGMLVACFSG